MNQGRIALTLRFESLKRPELQEVLFLSPDGKQHRSIWEGGPLSKREHASVNRFKFSIGLNCLCLFFLETKLALVEGVGPSFRFRGNTGSPAGSLAQTIEKDGNNNWLRAMFGRWSSKNTGVRYLLSYTKGSQAPDPTFQVTPLSPLLEEGGLNITWENGPPLTVEQLELAAEPLRRFYSTKNESWRVPESLNTTLPFGNHFPFRYLKAEGASKVLASSRLQLPDYLWAKAESGNEPLSDTAHQVRLRLADVSRVFVHGPCSAFNMLVIVQAVHTEKWRDQVVLWTRLETEADALEACNKIETLAKHDVVLVIDNALVHPDWVDRLHSIWKRNKVKSSLIVMARSSIEGGGPFEGREWAEDAIQTIIDEEFLKRAFALFCKNSSKRAVQPDKEALETWEAIYCSETPALFSAWKYRRLQLLKGKWELSCLDGSEAIRGQYLDGLPPTATQLLLKACVLRKHGLELTLKAAFKHDICPLLRMGLLVRKKLERSPTSYAFPSPYTHEFILEATDQPVEEDRLLAECVSDDPKYLKSLRGNRVAARRSGPSTVVDSQIEFAIGFANYLVERLGGAFIDLWFNDIEVCYRSDATIDRLRDFSFPAIIHYLGFIHEGFGIKELEMAIDALNQLENDADLIGKVDSLKVIEAKSLLTESELSMGVKGTECIVKFLLKNETFRGRIWSEFMSLGFENVPVIFDELRQYFPPSQLKELAGESIRAGRIYGLNPKSLPKLVVQFRDTFGDDLAVEFTRRIELTKRDAGLAVQSLENTARQSLQRLHEGYRYCAHPECPKRTSRL